MQTEEPKWERPGKWEQGICNQVSLGHTWSNAVPFHVADLLLLAVSTFTFCVSSPCSPIQLPANLYLYLQKLLSTGEHWAMVGSQLGLLSVEDINFYRDNPCNGGNGSVPLDRWKESTLTYKDLADVLKSQEVGLIKAANSVENFFSGDKTDFVFRLHSSRP